MTTTVGRLLVILSLAFAVVIATIVFVTRGDGGPISEGDANPGQMESAINAADQARAEGVIFRQRDFPSWWSPEAKDSEKNAEFGCSKISFADLTKTGGAESEAFFSGFTTSAFSFADILQTEQQAEKALTRLTGPTYMKCLGDSFKMSPGGELKVKYVSYRRVNFTLSLGDESAEYEILMEFRANDGVSYPAFYDVIVVRQKRVVSVLVFATTETTFDEAMKERLAKTVESRMASVGSFVTRVGSSPNTNSAAGVALALFKDSSERKPVDVWALIHPEQQSVTTREFGDACAKANDQDISLALAKVESVKVTDSRSVRKRFPKLGVVTAETVTIRVKGSYMGLKLDTPITTYWLNVGGEWRVLLEQKAYDAYKAGRCPNAQQASSGEQDVRVAFIPVEIYYQNHGGSYSGMTEADLKQIDPSIKNIRVVSADADTFCIASISEPTYYKAGRGGSITTTPCR